MEDIMSLRPDNQKYYDWQSDKEAFEYEVEQSLSDDSIKGLLKNGFILDCRRKLQRPVISDFNLHNVFIIYLASCILRNENRNRQRPRINIDAKQPYRIVSPYLYNYFKKYLGESDIFDKISLGEVFLGMHVAGIKIIFNREKKHVYVNVDNLERCTLLRSIKMLDKKLGLI